MTSSNATPMTIAAFETRMIFRHRSATSASSSSWASISEISSIGLSSAQIRVPQESFLEVATSLLMSSLRDIGWTAARRSIPRNLSFGWDSFVVSSSYIARWRGFATKDLAIWRRGGGRLNCRSEIRMWRN